MDNEAESTTQAEGLPYCNMTELQEDVDKGWRHFWKKRGYAEPPPLIDDQYRFGSLNFEKNSTKKGKQKEATGVPGVQEDRG